MTRTSMRQVLALILLSTAGTWGLLQILLRQGIHAPAVGWGQPFGIVLLAGLVTWGGLVVRAYLNGKRPKLAGITAARIAVFAKAGSLGGALFVGGYGAQVLVALENISVESQQARAWGAGAACIAALIFVVCAMIAERNCQLPPPTEDASEGLNPNEA
ncbi:DUF3180 domain-containing protein [Timonella sp. A28]|uniref:DUF3180 domain-containing protein n=1 Tax=Timonella sp. A28 TaxID=3442640 RepID=UPI003EBAE562